MRTRDDQSVDPDGPARAVCRDRPIKIADAEGDEIPEDGRTVKLCRCGHFGKKPYRDETHRRVDFVSRPSFLPEPANR